MYIYIYAMLSFYHQAQRLTLNIQKNSYHLPLKIIVPLQL